MIDNPALNHTKKYRVYPVNRVMLSCLLLPAIIVSLVMVSLHDYSEPLSSRLQDILIFGAAATIVGLAPALSIGIVIIRWGRKKVYYLSDHSEGAQKASDANKVSGGMVGAVAITALAIIFIAPNYCDYTGRTHVSEGMMLASTVRIAVAEYYQVHKRWPKDNHEAGLAENIMGNAVQSIKIVDKGVIIITYNKKIKERGELILTPAFDEEKKEMIWDCVTNTEDPKKTIKNKDLPRPCRMEATEKLQSVNRFH